MIVRAPFLLLLASLAVTACSSSSSGPSGGGGSAAGSCSIVGGQSCFDYPGSGFSASTVQQTCSAVHGTYSADACPTASRVGSCEVYAGQPSEQTVRYYSSGFTTDQAKANCTAQSGTFTPG
jgi:hypothetical protein